jgi:hypothetical protein
MNDQKVIVFLAVIFQRRYFAPFLIWINTRGENPIKFDTLFRINRSFFLNENRQHFGVSASARRTMLLGEGKFVFSSLHPK